MSQLPIHTSHQPPVRRNKQEQPPPCWKDGMKRAKFPFVVADMFEHIHVDGGIRPAGRICCRECLDQCRMMGLCDAASVNVGKTLVQDGVKVQRRLNEGHACGPGFEKQPGKGTGSRSYLNDV